MVGADDGVTGAITVNGTSDVALEPRVLAVTVDLLRGVVGLIGRLTVRTGLVAPVAVSAADLAEGVFLARRGDSPSIDLFFSIVYNYNMKAHKLTKKQLAVLEYIQDFTEENGYSPSYREIMAGLGLNSVSAVAEHVENLVEKGVLKKVPGASRSLEVLDYRHESTVELFKVKMVECTEEDKKILVQAAEILGIELE